MEDHETQLGILEATRASAHTHTQHPFPLPEGSGCLWCMQKAQMSLPLSHSSPGLRQSTCVRAFIALSSLSQVASTRLLWARIWGQRPGAACSMLRASSLRACTLAGPRIWTSSLKASNFSPRTCKSIEPGGSLWKWCPAALKAHEGFGLAVSDSLGSPRPRL